MPRVAIWDWVTLYRFFGRQLRGHEAIIAHALAIYAGLLRLRDWRTYQLAQWRPLNPGDESNPFQDRDAFEKALLDSLLEGSAAPSSPQRCVRPLNLHAAHFAHDPSSEP